MSGHGRRSKEITITEENRDQGKVFFIEEMTAVRTEKWATKALLALTRNGLEIPDHIVAAGIAGIATIPLPILIKGLRYEDAEPLLEEMLGCVQFRPDPVARPQYARPLNQVDIEEVSTLFRLRIEVLTLHTGFSLGVPQS